MQRQAAAVRPQDRRIATRVPYLCEVQLEGMGTGGLNNRISDLSTTGVFIDSITGFPVGSILKLRFWLRSREMRVTGEVRHSIPRIGMGVRFLDLDPADEAAIESVVREKLA